MWNKIAVGVFLIGVQLFTAAGMYHFGYQKGEHDVANKMFQWCHDEGGFLHNPETGQTIGCGQVRKGQDA